MPVIGVPMDSISSVDRVYAIFKVAGKIIKVRKLGAEQAEEMKAVLVATNGQQAANDADLYDELKDAILPFQTGMSQVVQVLNSVEDITKQGMRNYLAALADNLALTGAFTVSKALTALENEMEELDVNISPSGEYWSYFKEVFDYSFALDTRDNMVEDAWITATIV